MAEDATNLLFLYKLPDAWGADIPAPFDPDQRYPEYPGQSLGTDNPIYRAVRDVFHRLGYDKTNYGSNGWNPLGRFIRPGHTVLIKPNLVLHDSHREGEDFYSVITHPAIIRCLVDYTVLALKGEGRIIIGDAPLSTARFDVLRRRLGLDCIMDFYGSKGLSIDMIDFRLFTHEKDEAGVILNQRQLLKPGDYLAVDLGEKSLLSDVSDQSDRFRVTEYNGREMSLHHNAVRHEYCLHRSVLEADVVISLPKIKTHRKAGFTCAMKNWIGVNGSKDWLPHHRKGSRDEGGDEYLHKSLRKTMISGIWDLRWKVSHPILQRVLLALERSIRATGRLCPFPDPYFEGSWWGNATISRTVNDLNRIVLYADAHGNMHPTPQRVLLYAVDGIICGEGEGPLYATAKRCNLLLWGTNSCSIDLLVSTLIGFDYRKIDTLRLALSPSPFPLLADEDRNPTIRTNLDEGTCDLSTLRRLLRFSFLPPAGWKDHVELADLP